MAKFKQYKQTYRKGMEPIGDQAREWMTQEDYDKDAERVKHLKETGEYGQEYEVTYNFMVMPDFDSPTTFDSSHTILIPKGALKDGEIPPIIGIDKK